MTRIEFLREETLLGKNKCKRAPLPMISVADEPCSLSERKALATRKIFELMPIYIGEGELIVGTRTLFNPNKGNEDGHDRFAYGLFTRIPYVNESEIALFGANQSYRNRTHYTPDFKIILDKGIGGILADVKERLSDSSLGELNREFLRSVIIGYEGLSNLILRYSEEAVRLSALADEKRREELLEIGRICNKISRERPESFHEALQLLWFAHLGTMIESFEFINYGRLDVILAEYLGDTPREVALELVECLLLKMYDQVYLVTTYLGNYAAQLVVTLGGVLENGESAVNELTMIFLDAIDAVRLPEPEFNLRISSKNPPSFLDKAAELTVSGCNFVSYYNDDLFVKSLVLAGIPLEDARCYGFDLCQDINIPGKGDFWVVESISLAGLLMQLLKERCDYSSFEELLLAYKEAISSALFRIVNAYNVAEEHIIANCA